MRVIKHYSKPLVKAEARRESLGKREGTFRAVAATSQDGPVVV